MILHPYGDGHVAIAQSAHAMLAFQIADHWGNRFTPRPTPRAEVLAAVLLHDAGWDGREEPPRLADDGRPVAFDTVPGGEREAIWDSAVERAAVRGRYVAYLVSHHVSTLAGFGGEGVHREFLARQEALRARLREELASDPRYAEALASGPDEVNRSVLRLADAIAVHLATGPEGTVRLPNLPRRGGLAPLTLSKVAEGTYRLRPWPLVGRRLTVTAEGRLLPGRRFRDEASLAAAWRDAATVRLSWTLLATGAPSD
ncbi:MAG TPA: DUF3891 family protein [Thermoanaerobaculaceae bacterium]|nr:DUF3891 family protein [Thermoanaerobaculaceae bacterium]